MARTTVSAIEADGLAFLMRAHAPGIERLFTRISSRYYRTIVVHEFFPAQLQRVLFPLNQQRQSR